jgi:FkbM family methyltransferase
MLLSKKNIIHKLINRTGYGLYRLNQIGVDPYLDMQRFLEWQNEQVILDVGGNVGQSVARFKQKFPASSIHSFEPSPTTFSELEMNCKEFTKVKTWNYGVGSEEATLSFHENEFSDMSSFLTPGKSSWGKVVNLTDVQVITLDSFANEQGIEFIHILKSDTQGYDFEVFKGAKQLMKENRIGLIYFEVTFSDMYEKLPQFYDIFSYLFDNNFALVNFYLSHFQKELLGWTDALLINREFYKKRADSGAARNEDAHLPI